MAETLTEDIQSWGGIANQRFAQVCDLPEIRNDPEARRGFLSSMNEDVAHLIGTLNILMIGEDIRIVDAESTQIYRGRLAVQGRFSGASMDLEATGSSSLGYCLQLPEITVMDDDAPPKLAERAFVAMGPIGTTNVFADNDVFQGGIEVDTHIDAKQKDPDIAYAEEQFARIERAVDAIAAKSTELDPDVLREMGTIFTEYEAVEDGLELTHFMRRVNERLLIPGRRVTIQTSQFYTHNSETRQLAPVLNSDSEAIIGINTGLRFVVITDNDTEARMACLFGSQTNEGGIPGATAVVDVKDISNVTIVGD